MKPAVRAARLLLQALAVVLALGADQYASGQTQQKRQQVAPRPAQPPRRADDRRWQELMDQAEAQIAKGEYARGEETGRQLLEEALRIFGDGDPDTATSLNVLADAQMRQGKYADAQKNFSAALNIYEKRLGPEHINTAAALNNLALLYADQGRDARDWISMPGRVDHATLLESLLRRSLRILEKSLGQQHQDTATTLSNLGRVLDLQGKYSETSGAGTGEDPKQLGARAQELIDRGQYKEAETLQYRVVAIHDKTLGREHPVTATSLSNLGNVLYLQGKTKPRQCTGVSWRYARKCWGRSTRIPQPA